MNNNYSVLMSVYYKEKPEWLDISIQSMLNQTIKTNDFVLVEDGPLTKELDEIVNKYTINNPNLFNVVKLKENVGLGSALKIGIENCKNELIARMDSDDIAVPERCQKQIEKFIKNDELAICGSNIIEFIDDIQNQQAYRKLPETDTDIKKYMKRRNPLGHPSVMFKKSKVLEAGNYRTYYLCEDYDMWVRMAQKNAKFYNIQEPLVYMRISEDFYKRRGGFKYLKSMLKFKNEQYRNGFYTTKDYIISSGAHIVMCIIPNRLRNVLYKKILRRNINVKTN